MKRISAFLGALALVAAVPAPALATPQLDTLFSTIQATGTRLVKDDPAVCSDRTTLGMYQLGRGIDQYTICINNHKGDSAELYDTVLHEAVHVVQACIGGPIYTPASIIKAAKPEEVQLVATGYPNQQFNKELEARVVAREQDEVFITGLLRKHCFKR
jgi:hypothetical protein